MIGEEPDAALLCLTDLYQFFNESEVIEEYDVGQWYFLNGSAVSLNPINDIYTSRDLGIVRLHRKNNTSLRIGRFRCDILDSNKIRQRIYVLDPSYPGYVPGNEANSSPTATPCCVTVEAKVSAAVIGGAGAGGLLLMIITTVGIILVILFIKR